MICCFDTHVVVGGKGRDTRLNLTSLCWCRCYTCTTTSYKYSFSNKIILLHFLLLMIMMAMAATVIISYHHHHLPLSGAPCKISSLLLEKNMFLFFCYVCTYAFLPRTTRKKTFFILLSCNYLFFFHLLLSSLTFLFGVTCSRHSYMSFERERIYVQIHVVYLSGRHATKLHKPMFTVSFACFLVWEEHLRKNNNFLCFLL